MTEPERVYVTDGKLTVNLDDFGCLPCVALVLLVWSILCSGSWVSNAIDRNTAAMEAPPACRSKLNH